MDAYLVYASHTAKEHTMKQYMSSMLALTILMSTATGSINAGRRDTLRAVCAGTAAFTSCALMTAFEIITVDDNRKAKTDRPIAYMFAIDTGLIVASIPYRLLAGFTADARLEKAHERLENIIRETVVATKLPHDKESCMAMLEGMYTGDLWLFQAINRLKSTQDDVVKIIDDIALAREKAAGDCTFVILCETALQRANKVLRNVSIALRYAHMELRKQSEAFHAEAEHTV